MGKSLPANPKKSSTEKFTENILDSGAPAIPRLNVQKPLTEEDVMKALCSDLPGFPKSSQQASIEREGGEEDDVTPAQVEEAKQAVQDAISEAENASEAGQVEAMAKIEKALMHLNSLAKRMEHENKRDGLGPASSYGPKSDLTLADLQPPPDAERINEVGMAWPFRVDSDSGRLLVHVAVLGTPNAGKSSLVNRLAESKVTAVSPKRNTTRAQTLAVLTRHNTQMVLYDTPGVLEMKSAKKYERELTAEAWGATNTADLVMILVDAAKTVGPAEMGLIEKAKSWHQRTKKPVILVLNKCDLVKPKSKLLELANELNEVLVFSDVFYISASLNKFVDELQEFLFTQGKPGEWDFEPEDVTPLSDRQRVAEIVREKVFCRMNQEIPYTVTQETRGWEDCTDGSLSVTQALLVDTVHQQGILIGAGGSVLQAIKREAEADLGRIFLRPVQLTLAVHVKHS